MEENKIFDSREYTAEDVEKASADFIRVTLKPPLSVHAELTQQYGFKCARYRGILLLVAEEDENEHDTNIKIF